MSNFEYSPSTITDSSRFSCSELSIYDGIGNYPKVKYQTSNCMHKFHRYFRWWSYIIMAHLS